MKIFKTFHIASLLLVLIISCKTEEFKWKKLGLSDNWSTNFVAPLFTGDMEFKDFICNWSEFSEPDNITTALKTLKLNSGDYLKIDADLIFDSTTVVIKDYPLLIQGAYELDSITLVFDVVNASPYPLNLALRFSPNGLPVKPRAFDAGEKTGDDSFEPLQTVDSVELNGAQTMNFNNGKKMDLIAWYSPNDFQLDTLSAHYPIRLKITVKAKIKGKDEN